MFVAKASSQRTDTEGQTDNLDAGECSSDGCPMSECLGSISSEEETYKTLPASTSLPLIYVPAVTEMPPLSVSLQPGEVPPGPVIQRGNRAETADAGDDGVKTAGQVPCSANLMN